MSVKYVIDLATEERDYLRDITTKGKHAARKVRRAHILLLAAEETSDEMIAAALHASVSTIHRTRQRFVEEGIDDALNERPRPGVPRKLTGKQEAFLVALACSDAPTGRTTWTMQLLADVMVELKQVASLSDETVRVTLKKTKLSRGSGRNGAYRR
jgi:transposase